MGRRGEGTARRRRKVCDRKADRDARKRSVGA
jgi:hypothetical protein